MLYGNNPLRTRPDAKHTFVLDPSSQPMPNSKSYAFTNSGCPTSIRQVNFHQTQLSFRLCTYYRPPARRSPRAFSVLSPILPHHQPRLSPTRQLRPRPPPAPLGPPRTPYRQHPRLRQPLRLHPVLLTRTPARSPHPHHLRPPDTLPPTIHLPTMMSTLCLTLHQSSLLR